MNSKYKELSEQAYAYHTNNELDKAEIIYEKLIELRPEDVNVLNLYGLLCIATNKCKKAISLLTKAMILKKNAYIITNLAKAYYLDNQPEKAVKLYNNALTLAQTDDIYYSLGLAYKKLKNYDEVIKNYLKAVELNENNYKALYNLALAYKNQNDIDKAVIYGEKCLRIKKDDYEVYTFLSECYEKRGYYELAIKALDNAIELNPENPLYYYNLGVLYSKIKNTDKAIENYEKALKYKSNYIEAYVNLGYLYKNKDTAKALNYYKKAYELNPIAPNVCYSLAQMYKDKFNNAESIEILKKFDSQRPNISDTYSLLASNYMDIGDYNSAYTNYCKAIVLNETNLSYMHGKAVSLKYLGYIDEAKKILEEIVSKDESQIQSCITLGMIYLQEKDFEKGMNLYKMRSLDTKFSELFHDKILNKKEDIENKTILIYTDCGLGDTIMFSRYIPFVSNIAKKVILQTDKELYDILKNNYPNIKVITKTDKTDDYDFVVPIMNIPLVLNMDFDSIPSKSGYIKPNQEKTEKFSQLEIFNTPKKKVGIFYRGNKKIFKNREMDYEYIKKITDINDCVFYSFQIDAVTEDENVVSLKSYIKDYDDTASLLKNMDVLVTIDSSIAHMAGSLGVKTFLLLPKTAEWRWFNDTENTPWYKSVKIFKQKDSGDWSYPVENVIKELNKHE